MLFATTVSLYSQSLFTGTAVNPTAIISNATADTIKLTVGADKRVTTISALISKTSGTMAGTVRLYGTMWDSTGTWFPLSDTLTLSDAAVNKKTWTITDNGYPKLYIIQSGGTTVKGYLRAKATAIK